MANLISKTVMVTAGPNKGLVGTVVQQDATKRLLIESSADKKDRRFAFENEVVVY